MTDAQAKMVGKTYRAVVGSAKQSDFRNCTNKAIIEECGPSSNKPTSSSVSYDKDPLSELLGHPPKRFNDNSSQLKFQTLPIQVA